RLSTCLLARGWLELWILELDGEIGAVQFAFRYGENVFQLQEGYDSGRNSDRLGYVLRGEVLKRLISEKVRTYDFLGGEDSYKTRWGTHQGYYRHLQFAPSFEVGGACLQILHKTGRSKEWLRQRLPNQVWKLLQNAHATVQRKDSAS